jgi:hypothetical protein
MNRGRDYHVVIYDEFGNYTRTTEYSILNDYEFVQSKMKEGYIYNRIIGFILVLTKYNINVRIQDILTPDESNSEVWEYEKNTYGEYWVATSNTKLDISL